MSEVADSTSDERISWPALIKGLPNEVFEKVLSYLSASDLGHASMVSHSWRDATNVDALWIHLCLVNNWMKFGLNTHILSEPDIPLDKAVSHHSPSFTYKVPKSISLPSPCKWKMTYMRCLHLMRNWQHGRYVVEPILRGHKEKVLALDSNDTVIVSGGADSRLRIWDIESRLCLHDIQVPNNDAINAVKIIEDTVVAGCSDGSIKVYNAYTASLVATLWSHIGSVDHIAFDGRTVTSCSADKTLKVWDLCQSIGKLKYTLHGHTDEIEFLSTHKDLAVTGSWDRLLIMWDISKGVLVCTLSGHTEVVTCCQFDNYQLVSGSADGTVRIWSTNSGKCKRTLTGHLGEVYCVVYNESVIASGSSDSTVKIWDFSGKCIHTLGEHLGVVRCLYIDDYKLISGGDAKKLMVWNYKTGELFNIIHRQPTLLHLMLVTDTKLVTASPERPGTITMLSYWK
ncbi:unnamed protein product [Owenia fusiformis]|uniref:F-box domain-containing protein n=1 Tax=Owenia fusiformis TaxID=6347 RepID=A0A8S4PJ75_OWEFU|nr:unnamed protein product [Owenia fusiformis]